VPSKPEEFKSLRNVPRQKVFKATPGHDGEPTVRANSDDYNFRLVVFDETFDLAPRVHSRRGRSSVKKKAASFLHALSVNPTTNAACRSLDRSR
jgi:hypothetical protein